MQAAPPVVVRCTARWTWRAFQAVLPALAAGVFVFWGVSTWAAETALLLRIALLLLAAVSVGLIAWWRSAHAARTLDWDGQRWALDGQPGDLQLMIDLGSAMLLRHGGKHWLMASRTDAGTGWHALRVAVFARSSFHNRSSDDHGWLNA
jgi:hypothetical protein